MYHQILSFMVLLEDCNGPLLSYEKYKRRITSPNFFIENTIRQERDDISWYTLTQKYLGH